jgi:hypothetical protein
MDPKDERRMYERRSGMERRVTERRRDPSREPVDRQMAPKARRSARRLESELPRVYRRKAGGAWHWCRNCSRYPRGKFEERLEMPTLSELCRQCRSKESRGECSG